MHYTENTDTAPNMITVTCPQKYGCPEGPNQSPVYALFGVIIGTMTICLTLFSMTSYDQFYDII